MIVYGDPSFSQRLHALISSLDDCVRAIESSRADRDQLLDAVRRCLIEAGELEQAVEDSGEIDPHVTAELRSTTDRIAEAFCAVYLGDLGSPASVDRAIQSINALTRLVSLQSDRSVRVKVPEGFAFYTLFPEQYVSSAASWAAGQQLRGAKVAVVGIRSIGTTLSAVVCAALRSKGWPAYRLTVRPSGHPFDRRVNFQSTDLKEAEFAIVVDEGPGASGSSMAAVGRGLVEAGFHAGRISFLPGHGSEPGLHASAEVRKWWASTPRFSTPLNDLRWNRRSLRDKLAEQTELLYPGGSVDRVDGLSGGWWRRMFGRADPPPPAFPAFERTKYRCSLGDGRAVLWKFIGFSADAQNVVAQIHARHDAGWTSQPIGTCLGFVALPWINGTPLTRNDLSAQLLQQIGRYIRESAGTPLHPHEASAAFERLREMLYWNTSESLGDDAAQRCGPLSDLAAKHISHQPIASYGDGRLGPYEWVRTPEGSLQKLDCAGHDRDHTIIGRQPILWDVAGAAIEWDLSQQQTAMLLGLVAPQVAAQLLRFYCAAYAAFRIGMAVMCQVDSTFFREKLARMLQESGA